MGGIPHDCNEGLSGLLQLEGEMFSQRDAASPETTAWALLETSAALGKNGGVGSIVGRPRRGR